MEYHATPQNAIHESHESHYSEWSSGIREICERSPLVRGDFAARLELREVLAERGERLVLGADVGETVDGVLGRHGVPLLDRHDGQIAERELVLRVRPQDRLERVDRLVEVVELP